MLIMVLRVTTRHRY